MIQRRPIKRGLSRARWTTRDWATSLTISAFWHLMVLAVLALEVHPLQLPDVNRSVDLELLPPLTPPPTQTVDVQLRPREEEPEPAPRPPAPTPRTAPPEPVVPPKAAEAQPAPQPPLETARPTPPQLANPVEVERRSVQAPRLQTQQAIPQIPEAPPEPVTVTRPNSALPPPIEAPRVEASRRTGPLDTTRVAPQLPAAPAAEAEAPAAVAPQVLTNSSVVQAPVEIRPRERAPIAPRLNTQAGAPEIPAPSGGAPAPAGGGGGAAGGQAGGARPSLGDFSGINGGLGLKGLRTGLGCENPDTYKLTPEERDACLKKFGERARGAPQLGLNIPDSKKAAYDRYTACQVYKSAPVPGSNSASGGTSIAGLGANPSLKECGPGDR